MSSARLTALRLVGFKSFAERTTVEFGPGISAVVGPNGSGKSNLADALRWTLGEQGRSLRTRRSEDVIFAGSSSRRAIGMADVTLVIDNHDRLLPVDFGEVEIGRRLYRSGENEYLLNRQRIRLRDLVELLDAGNLADNAFLFIGQGMVDQALALRPEERRPLFEEAAGVRRHERRRRQAENELTEAESNLERLRDVLTELRPQARRLSAQAEQVKARKSAGVELAEALLAAAGARWRELAAAATKAHKEIERARSSADGALVKLKQAEQEAAALSSQIGQRTDSERGQRVVLDRLRQRLADLRIDQARLESELEALTRDRQRVTTEREAAQSRRATASGDLSQPEADVDPALAHEIELIERRLGESHPSAVGDGAALLGARRAEQTQLARRLAGLETNLEQAAARHAALRARLESAQAEHASTVDALTTALNAERAAHEALSEARAKVEELNAARSVAQERSAAAQAELAEARARVAALEQAVNAATDAGLAHAARARGAALLGEGLEVDPRFRLAVSAALGPALTAFLVLEADVLPLAARRGMLALATSSRRDLAAIRGGTIEAAAAAGGGRLSEAIRRDPQGAVTQHLQRTVWLPDLARALGIRSQLGPGWRAVTLAGEVVTEDGLVVLASGESAIDLRAERDSQAAELAGIEARTGAERQALENASAAFHAATAVATAAHRTWEEMRTQLRRAEGSERAAQRPTEEVTREANWERRQVERLTAEVDGARALVERLNDEVASLESKLEPNGSPGAQGGPANDAAQLRSQLAELRRRHATQQAAAQAAQEVRRRAEVGALLDEARLRDLDVESERIALRESELGARQSSLSGLIEAARAEEAAAGAALEQVVAAGTGERTRLVAAEQIAIASREALRDAEARARDADVQALGARLSLEQTREQLLVELAGIGGDGMAALSHAAGDDTTDTLGEVDAQVMEALLGRVTERWQSAAKGTQAAADVPSSGRLASLRRKFHELGAGNPFAAEEYEELSERLETLDAQRSDMESAITSTRELIRSLSTLINDQFRSTFAALEDAFARRFSELFDGGEAQLSLTAPDDLSTTGVEIHARPPGKKRQPLSMLSGGERALTAVSLLLAMLEVRPVPFCVLDEVDAALDEANVGRFSKALRGLAEHTQFIVITHNRGTIEGADALYGVTIGDDAVSRVVSLRLPGQSAQSEGNGRAAPEVLVT